MPVCELHNIIIAAMVDYYVHAYICIHDADEGERFTHSNGVTADDVHIITVYLVANRMLTPLTSYWQYRW